MHLITFGKTICGSNWCGLCDSDPFIRVYYVIDGTAYYHNKEMNMALKKGHLYLFSSKTKYNFVNDEKRPLNVLWFHIFSDIPINTYFVELCVNSKSPIGEVIDILCKFSEDEYTTTTLFTALYKLLLKEKNFKTPVLPDFIADTIRTINTLPCNIKSSDFAKMHGYSQGHFNTLFRRYMGLSCHKYIQNTKMEHAISLLSDGKSIKHIAILLGYESINNFSRDFKQYYGFTPTGYLNSLHTHP